MKEIKTNHLLEDKQRTIKSGIRKNIGLDCTSSCVYCKGICQVDLHSGEVIKDMSREYIPLEFVQVIF